MCHFCFSPKEIFDLETNEHVQKAIDDRQMPKLEYRKIEIDDYSKYYIFSFERKSRPSAVYRNLPQLQTPGLTARKLFLPAKGRFRLGN